MKTKNKFKLVSFIILNITFFLFLYSETAIAKTTTATFLKSEVGSRYVAMGGAATGSADDINSIYYNPAGLINIKGHEATFMYNQSFMDSSYGFLAYAVNLKDKGSIGASLTYAQVLDIKETIAEYPTGTGNFFSAQDIALSLSYAKKITNHISFGNNLKLIKGKIEKESAFGFALDLGLLAKKVIYNNFSFGLSVQNIGSKMKYIEEGDSLPLNIKFGTSCKILNDKLLIALDVNKPIDNDLNIKTGLEYNLFNILSIRGGYSTGPSDIGSGLSVGLGFKYSLFNLDLSYVPYGDLGNMVRVSISCSQNKNLSNYSENNEYEEDNEYEYKEYSDNGEYYEDNGYLEEVSY